MSRPTHFWSRLTCPRTMHVMRSRRPTPWTFMNLWPSTWTWMTCSVWSRSTLSKDGVVQYGSRWLQIEPEPYGGNKVTVRQRRDGSLKLVCGERVLRWHENRHTRGETAA